MEKNKRDINLIALQMVARNVAKLMELDGICSLKPSFRNHKEMPSVQMLADTFLEYFGEDTEYEFVTYGEDDRYMETVVDGVLFYALVH